MNKLGTFIASLCVAVITLSGSGFANDGEDYIEPVGNGAINWSKGIITGVGIGAPPQKYYGKPQARPMALRAAKLDALRNILEVVNGVRIDSHTIVKDFAIESDIIQSKVQGMVRGAQEVKKEYMSDGTVEVTMKMDMSGGFAQLTLPDDIKAIQPIASNASAPGSDSGYTGVVVDARGLGVRPAMAPRIVDEEGQEVYGSAFVSREFAVQQGMSGYAKDLDEAQKNTRVADNPLMVTGLRTEGPGQSDVVISQADAASLRNAAEHLSFLRKCRVMIVVD